MKMSRRQLVWKTSDAFASPFRTGAWLEQLLSDRPLLDSLQKTANLWPLTEQLSLSCARLTTRRDRPFSQCRQQTVIHMGWCWRLDGDARAWFPETEDAGGVGDKVEVLPD